MKKSERFKHVIMTRFNNGIYDKTEEQLKGLTPVEWMKQRYSLFKATRESVLTQKGNFEWVISFDPNTPDGYVQKCITDDRMTATCDDVRDYFTGMDIVEPWVITSRIDNDDLYRPGFVKAVQDAFEEKLMAIDIDYYQYDIRDLQKYTSERYTATSPFMSLVEPSDNVKTVYCRPHNKIVDGYPFKDGNRKIPAVKIHGQYAYMVIHNDNMANKIVGKPVK